MESAATFHEIVLTPNGDIRDPQALEEEETKAEIVEDSKYEINLAYRPR